MAAEQLRRAGTGDVATFACLPGSSTTSSLIRGAVWLLVTPFQSPGSSCRLTGILGGALAKRVTNAAKETEVWGQLLLARRKAVLGMGDLLAVFALRWLFCNAGNSLWGQTPVGTEHLELLGLRRRKTDYLCWNLTVIKSPPPRKLAVGFLRMQES